jgi:hypothetical protein
VSEAFTTIPQESSGMLILRGERLLLLTLLAVVGVNVTP